MKFISFFKKLQFFSIKLLLLSTLAMITMSVATGYFVSKQSNESLGNVIYKSLEQKGRLQMSNVNSTMLGLLEDNAFSSMEELFTSVLQNDSDFIYINFIDTDNDQWFKIDDQSREAKIKRSSNSLVYSKDSISIEEVETDSFPIIVLNSTIINDEEEKLGDIIIILSTKRMNSTKEMSQRALIKSNIIVSVIAIVVVAILLLIIGYFISKKFAYQLSNPIRKLKQAAGEIATGNYNISIDIKTNDEIGEVASQFDYMVKQIITFQEQAVTDAELSTEMEIAKNIQTSLLPDTSLIKDTGYEISASMVPAEKVGGDYYDVVRDVEGRLWFGIGDVTGHGLISGLVMMMTQVSVNTILKSFSNISPSDLLIFINRIIQQNIRKGLKVDYHMTICFLVEKDPGHFLYAGAHETIMIYRAETQTVDLIETKGMWIGIIPEISKQILKGAGEFTMKTGDVCLLYTDGVTEIKNKENQQYNVTRLVNFLTNNVNENNLDQLSCKLLDELDTFKKKQLDDITFLFFKKQ